MYAGDVMSATSTGQLTQLNLTTHNYHQMVIIERDNSVTESNLKKQLALNK